ncbi:MAG: phage tail protein [Dysgonamonadaceae bacterium]|jgi:P2-related tail formation protein|nr:phage tail protein [Dysgonamonadaceae bacterium]
MDERHVIASSLADNEWTKAFSELVAERWDNFDMAPFMVYLVDSCDASVLPYLADQFDVAGLQGFEIAANEEQQRALIKRSIALHKFIGTPWAIREACRTVGFPVIILDEGVSIGEAFDYDWAQFRVMVEADVDRAVPKAISMKLHLFIGFYKNERSHLVDFGFYQSMKDEYVFTAPVEERDPLNIDIISSSVFEKDEYVFTSPVEERDRLHIALKSKVLLIGYYTKAETDALTDTKIGEMDLMLVDQEI